jgi:hypothetical protein
MKIRLSVIPCEKLETVRSLVNALRDSVNLGNTDGMDAATDELLVVTKGARSIDFSEEEWRRFLVKIRTKHPTFQSDYLLSVESCCEFFSDEPPEMMVLQLPFNEEDITYV